jgi:hypothetical protein
MISIKQRLLGGRQIPPAAWKEFVLKRRATSSEAPDNVSSAVQGAAEVYSLGRPAEQDVAELAYRRWVDRGCPQGSPEEDWFEAERDLLSQSRS